MAQTLQQLADMIRASGASNDAKRIDDAVAAFERAGLSAFGVDYSNRSSGIQGLTCKQAVEAVGLALKAYRIGAAQQDALDRAIAALQRELG